MIGFPFAEGAIRRRPPRRIQLSRKRGWRKPPRTLVVGRPSAWGNPFLVIPGRTDPAEMVDRFRRWLAGEWPNIDPLRRERILADLDDGTLRGQNLACWCPPDQPSHADVLLELANGWTP